MGQQPQEGEMERVKNLTEGEDERRERANFIGEQIEKNIKEDQDVFLSEMDRLWLKEIVEQNRSLEPIVGAANLSQQMEATIEVFSVNGLRNQGCDQVGTLMTYVVSELVESESGNVFDKAVDEITEEDKLMVADFVKNIFDGFYDEKVRFVPERYEKGSWERKALYRIEAVEAVLNKLLWILQAPDEAEAKRRQNTPGIKKHVRERILRGLEKEGEKISKEVSRVDPEEVIRHLPKYGVSYILDATVRM